MGDVFFTDAVAVLMQIQRDRNDELYLFSNFDVHVYYPNKLCDDTFGKQIRSCLCKALEEHNELPTVILVITGNNKVDQMVSTPMQTKRIWQALLLELDRIIKARKDQLPRKAVVDNQPRIYFTNMFPRHKDHCDKLDKGEDTFKTKRRRLNSLLPAIGQKYDVGIIPVVGLLPDDHDQYSSQTGELTGKGLKEFWYIISKELKYQEVKFQEKLKSEIIKQYFDEQREQRRIQGEQNKGIERFNRNSLPRSFPRDFNRGDGRAVKGRAKDNFRGRRANSQHR